MHMFHSGIGRLEADPRDAEGAQGQVSLGQVHDQE